jgi:uncharacterized membrane protein YfcA
VISDAPFVMMSFVVGVLVGLTSMGGAALMTPFLILVVGVRPMMAVGTDLVYGAVTKIVGAWMHWRQDTVDLGVVLRMACGSVPAGVGGVLLVRHLHDAGMDPDQYLRRMIGVVLVVVAVLLLIRTFYKLPTSSGKFLERHRTLMVVVWGAVVGFAVGLTSVGSGSLIAPFLVMLFPTQPAKVVGTDVFHAAVLVTATAFLYGQAGHVNWQLVPLLLAGSIPGVLIGSYLAPRLPVRTLRVALSVLLFTTGLKLV